MTELDFARWAAAYSQRTNRSLAGARVTVPLGRHDDDSVRAFADAAAQWGMIVTPADNDGTADMTDMAQDALNACASPECNVRDARELSGREAIDYAEAHMTVLRALMARLRDTVDFTGVRIAVCLVLEPKTAVLLRALRDAGATVGMFADPSETDQRVADQLAREGVAVEANAGWTPEETQAGALRLLDTIRPQIIIDDGASFARLAAEARPELLADDFIGVAEETTSGVRAFQAMQDAGALTFPVIAVNDSVLKTGFDNMHGTGETCVTTMQELLGAHCFAGKTVAVIGYGPVGRGFAVRVRALGATVTVCDTDPVAALKAVFDGFAARDIDDAIAQADIVVSATGVRHTIALEHMRRMREGAVLSVIGGIANEIALDGIPDFRHDNARSVSALAVPDGPTLTLLAEGDGVNYTAGGGNPIEIMDLSFAVQASAVAYLLAHRGTVAASHGSGNPASSHAAPSDASSSDVESSNATAPQAAASDTNAPTVDVAPLSPGLHRLDAASDRRIAQVALDVRGQSASHAVADNGYDWRLTRFADAN
ncbi:adenosylhomocysteinase [Bifidobacterium sp. 82T10]|uniref:Adenosylhomocysteinase n=1 Tax=Bifidobacterium miconis TaxID=2834435 RepID=A0ABS6WF92_9BIFI|nr:adenosylhomocysteinase [Bifidobacterium miconis]MBW3092690.1 adenosylhomocysteinase [Bifidobacterium miconis]